MSATFILSGSPYRERGQQRPRRAAAAMGRGFFFVQRRLFVLVDEAIGDARGSLDLHFQLAPGPVRIDPATQAAHTRFREGANVLVWADAQAPVALQAEEGWFSPEHNRREPMPAFRSRHASTAAPARFLTALAVWKAGAPLDLAADVEGGIGAAEIEARLRGDGALIILRRAL